MNSVLRPNRVLVPTLRKLHREVFRCGIYEAEDVLEQIGNISILPLEAGANFRILDAIQKRLVYRDPSNCAIFANPGLRPVVLEQNYDLLVYICQFDQDLPYINAIKSWRDRCQTTVCWIDEIWISAIPKSRRWLEALRQFDHVVVGSSSNSVGKLSEVLGKTCHWVPLGVDTLRFSPRFKIPARSIDVFNMGRVAKGVDQHLREMTRDKGIFYLHDTFGVANSHVFDHRDHRTQMANILQRSQYFLVGPAKVDNQEETKGQVEFGPRFYEGAAGGAILIGEIPNDTKFRELFPWRDAVVEILRDGSDIAKVLTSLADDPKRRLSISIRNIAETMLRHDWVYRWQQIYAIAGMEMPSGMDARIVLLRELANTVINFSEG